MLHHFHSCISRSALPDKFTFPFHYEPHPLCIMAAEEVQAYLSTQTQWKEEISGGKMFGVLVVENEAGEIGFLAAFSGNLAHSNCHPYFVPPVFDMLNPDGFFKTEEAHISAINQQIYQLEQSSQLLIATQELQRIRERASVELEKAKKALKEAKQQRDLRRSEASAEELQAMTRESQYQKAEYRRLERRCKDAIQEAQRHLDTLTDPIRLLCEERKTRSARLQKQLFDAFRMRNAKGEIKTLTELFVHTPQQTPPAGAGECAAPKLLQYAYLHKMRPRAMAEFWWGESPKTELRIHGHFYPACKGKCEPILKHMLQGLCVDSNPLSIDRHRLTSLPVVYEDEWIMAVNKPEGMLSVPGKLDVDSVYDRIRSMRPDASGPLIVHRLDMSTSGLLLIAKTKEIHKQLQALFKNHQIKKKYVALLDGSVTPAEGIIELPLCLNLHERPRQMVHHTLGKTAVTRYQVIGQHNGITRINFFPLTGRTHQLRVHAAHILGLNAPIVGDMLYGKKADRLFLHATSLEFVHPVTGKTVLIETDVPF